MTRTATAPVNTPMPRVLVTPTDMRLLETAALRAEAAAITNATASPDAWRAGGWAELDPNTVNPALTAYKTLTCSPWCSAPAFGDPVERLDVPGVGSLFLTKQHVWLPRNRTRTFVRLLPVDALVHRTAERELYDRLAATERDPDQREAYRTRAAHLQQEEDFHRADGHVLCTPWRPISRALADDRLNCLPPIMRDGGFLVSEPYSVDAEGRNVYTAIAEVGGQFYMKLCSVARFAEARLALRAELAMDRVHRAGDPACAPATHAAVRA